ncbi:MAG TPA: hypothetical protein VFU28_19535 [Vicinamibacterales bacterium]|nr:hypothetical protein [Vicinamibacterales bacterium]
MRLQTLVISVMLISACGGSDYGSGQPSSPSPVPSSSAAPAVPTTVPAGFQLSGTVFETTAQGSRAVSGGRIFFWIGSLYGGQIVVDASGRYVIPGLGAAPIVRLTWMPDLQMSELGFHQPCPANVAMPSADTHRDIEVVRSDSPGFRYDSPTLSGVVYESTADGRRPLPHTRVLYSIDASSGFDAYTDTDADGRYILCRIPRGSGRLGAGDCNDAVFWFPVDVNGDMSVDADLRPFKEACR